MNDLNSAFRGAVDLSALANKVVKEKIDGPQSEKKYKVPSLIVDLDEQIARSVIQISAVVPVILSFYAKDDAASLSLTEKLEKLVLEDNGKWFLAKVDMSAQLVLVEAFAVTQSATVAMILGGEPRPLFQGDQSVEDLKLFLEKLVALAKDQGLTGELMVSEDSDAEVEEELSPAEQAAMDAMAAGNYQAAVKIYEDELAKHPGDEMLIERLAQVKLVSRTFDGEIEKELAVMPADVYQAKRKADYHMAIGDAEGAFKTLLDFFDQVSDRAELTSHLLELFNVAGKNHPAVILARKQLAAKMF